MTDTPVNHANGIPQQPASGVQPNTDNFDNNLSSADTTVQKALDTIDNLSVGGATTFTGLTDTPSSYSGQGGKVAAVNVGETGLEFITAGGGISPWDATAGATGADYTTVVLAYAAGKRSILLVDDVTETATLAIAASDDLDVYIPTGYNWNHGANFGITHGGGGEISVTVLGNWIYALTGGTRTFIDGTSSTHVYVTGGGIIDNNSTATSSKFSDVVEHIHNVWFALPNKAGSGFSGGLADSHYSNVHLVGGGSSCSSAFQITKGGQLASDIVLTGTFSTTVIAVTVSNGAQLSGLQNDTSQQVTFSPQNDAVCSGVTCDDGVAGCKWFVSSGLNRGSLSDCNLNQGTLDIWSSNSAYDSIRDVATLDLTASGASNNVISASDATNLVSVAGDWNHLSDNNLKGGAETLSGADDNGFVNNKMLDTAGGSTTLDIKTGSNRTRASMNVTDIAIIDNGTASGVDPVTNTVA